MDAHPDITPNQNISMNKTIRILIGHDIANTTFLKKLNFLDKFHVKESSNYYFCFFSGFDSCRFSLPESAFKSD